MYLDDLHLFHVIVTTGSLSAAADELGISKGTVSRRLTELEQQLDTVLLNRSTRRIETTAAGRELYERSAPLIRELDGIRADIQAGQKRLQGPVSVRMPLEFFSPQITGLMNRFLDEYPDTTLLCTQYTQELPDYVGGEDLCFAWYEDRLPDSDWIATPLMSIQQGIYASPSMPNVAVPEALADLPCLTRPGENHWYFRAAAATRAVRVGGRLKYNSPGLRLQAASDGHWICKLPCYLGDPAVAAGTLQRLDMGMQPLALEVALLYRNRNLPERIRAFIDFFQSNIAAGP